MVWFGWRGETDSYCLVARVVFFMHDIHFILYCTESDGGYCLLHREEEHRAAHCLLKLEIVFYIRIELSAIAQSHTLH
jgi:hypothetical protein